MFAATAKRICNVRTCRCAGVFAEIRYLHETRISVSLRLVFQRRREPAQSGSPTADRALVTIYHRAEAYYVSTKVQTTAGVWTEPGEPARTVPRDADAVEIGAAVIEALAPPVRVVAHPARDAWTAYRRASLGPIQAQAGVRSWRAFMSGTSVVDVQRAGSRVTVCPMRRDGRRSDVWHAASDHEIHLDAPNPEVLGDAIGQATASGQS